MLVFERLTVEARSAVQRGHAESRAMQSPEVNSGHYLLGLVATGDSAAASVLDSVGMTADRVRACLSNDGPAQAALTGLAPVSEEAKRALRAADRLSRGGDIGSNHVLLGLVDDPDCMAARIVTRLGVEPSSILEEVARRAGP